MDIEYVDILTGGKNVVNIGHLVPHLSVNLIIGGEGVG